ncbi:uncharacterized protein LOC105662552 isoform X1 [Megachile rotundata]|uniref:uncharacterized protein LOC105662552 isoform X1 n=1 Tax=Megachile rotundata TaxID=143995 RepID=UPI003FD50F8E
MWGFLPAVTLLIGVILAGCEIVTLSEGETDASIEDRLSDDSKTWKEPLVMGEEERIDLQTDATDEQKNVYLGHPEDRRIDFDSDSRGVSNRRDNVDSWLALAAKSKELRNLPSSQRRRKKKKKTTATTTPWIYRWGNKRRGSADGMGSGIRMFRLPFNSWGGKRGPMTFSALQDNLFDRYGRDFSVDGNGVKKKAEDIERDRGKLPFNSWGGKRSERQNDRQQFLTYLKERMYTPVLDVYKVHETIKGKSNGKNDDKENNFIYRISGHLYNETNQDDSSDVDGRPIVEKRMNLREICKKPEYVSWAGKRSIKLNGIRFDNTVAIPADTEKGKTLLCCFPFEGTK